MADIYVNMQDALTKMDKGGLLVGNNLEWAREAVMMSTTINLDRFVSGALILGVFDRLREIAGKAEQGDEQDKAYSNGIHLAISTLAHDIYMATGNADFEFGEVDEEWQ